SGYLEKLITGKSKIVIKNGEIDEEELVKLHLTVDQLEMHLRQNNVSSIEEIELATLEPSGRLGFTLKEAAKPATKQDIQQLKQSLDQFYVHLNETSFQKSGSKYQIPQANQKNLFTKVDKDEQN